MATESGNEDMISIQRLKEEGPIKYLLKDNKLIVDTSKNSAQCQYIIGIGDNFLLSTAHDYDSQHNNVVKLDNISRISSAAASFRSLITPNMSRWGGIPLDLARKIAEHIEFYEDFAIFGQVCSMWRLGIKDAKVPSSYHTPWLMLAKPPLTSKHQYYNLFTGDIRNVDLPVPRQFHDGMPEEKFQNLPPKGPLRDEKSNWRYFSTKGWLVCITQLGLKITLVNPWSGEVIEVPCMPNVYGSPHSDYSHWEEDYYCYLYVKFALSESPSNSKDFILAMIFPMYKTVFIWRNGDNHWSSAGWSCKHNIDVLFYKGKLYIVNNIGYVKMVELEPNKGGTLATISVAQLGKEEDVPFELIGQGFLVEVSGKLFLVRREVQFGTDEEEFRTLYFEIWEVNVETGELNRVNNLGNMAIFIGYNSSFSLEALPGRGCKPNCIYYTDSMYELYSDSPRGGGTDMGVFDLSLEKKIEDFYDGPSRYCNVTPPLWIED